MAINHFLSNVHIELGLSDQVDERRYDNGGHRDNNDNCDYTAKHTCMEGRSLLRV